MTKGIAIDEQALIEKNTHLKVLSSDQFKERVLENCWQSLRSTKEKQLKFRAQEVKALGYFVAEGGVQDAICVYNPNGNLPLFDAVMTTAAKLSTDLKLSMIFQSQEANNHSALVSSFTKKQWDEIPIDIAQEMLEEIESKLRNSAFSIAYFKDFDSTSPLLKTYAYNLIDQPNVVVILECTLDLRIPLPTVSAFDDDKLLSLCSLYCIQPNRADMNAYSNLCNKGAE